MRLIDADSMKADLLTVDPQYETMIQWCITVLDAQPTIEPEQRWIPCSERLPEADKPVFVYLFYDSPHIAWLSEGAWFTDDFIIDKDDEPTAWMPLPEPYREEGGQK